jgi:hypothetical protein
VVHGDLKSSDVRVVEGGGGGVKVMDVGLAALTLPPSALDRLAGTAGQRDAGADVREFAAIAWETLTGVRPVAGAREPPSRGRRDMPRGVDELLLACLQGDVATAAAELAAGLRRCAAGAGRGRGVLGRFMRRNR